MKVGWIGLGAIGTQMALRVLGAGHALTAYARGMGQEPAADAGARLVSDYAQVAADCDVLGICLYSDAQVRETLLNAGALHAMRPGSVLVVHTTGSPTLAAELGRRAPCGVEVIDACFSGGPHEAGGGNLIVMAGGTPAGMERAASVLAAYAGQIHHVGRLGSGQSLKLLNNLLFATNLKHAAEAVGLAASLGLDPLLAAQVIQASSGASMAMGRFVRASPEATMPAVWPYLAKDVRTIAQAAEEAGLDLSSFRPVIEHFS